MRQPWPRPTCPSGEGYRETNSTYYRREVSSHGKWKKAATHSLFALPRCTCRFHCIALVRIRYYLSILRNTTLNKWQKNSYGSPVRLLSRIRKVPGHFNNQWGQQGIIFAIRWPTLSTNVRIAVTASSLSNWVILISAHLRHNQQSLKRPNCNLTSVLSLTTWKLENTFATHVSIPPSLLVYFPFLKL